MNKTLSSNELVEQIQKYARYYKNGAMDIKLAKMLAQPYIDAYNQIAKKVAKQQKCRAKEINFSFFMR